MFDRAKHEEAMAKLQDTFGDAVSFNGQMLIFLSMIQQPTDITFYKSPPKLNVKVSSKLSEAMNTGIGPEKLAKLLSAIPLSDGSSINLEEIWTLCPMPEDGFTEEELANVDMSQAQNPIGQQGETLRTIIKNTYHCKTVEEEDKFIRRWLAS